MTTQVIPKRNELNKSDTWDLTVLFQTSNEWETALNELTHYAQKLTAFKDTLSSSAEICVNCLDTYAQFEVLAEKVGTYAHLLKSGDESDSTNIDRYTRYIMKISAIQAQLSFLAPEIQAIPEEKIRSWIHSSRFEEYRVFIEKQLRMKKHVLSEKEERIMALQSEVGQTARSAFSVLTNVDFDFGTLTIKNEEKPLTQTTWSSFMENEDRDVRKNAYHRFYGVFDEHKNTLANLYAASVQNDIFNARARGYSSSIEKALFPDKIELQVYDTLVSTVRKNLEPLHRYYRLRKKMLKLDELRHYDVYVPLAKDIHITTSYNEAVDLLEKAFAPLGDEYTSVLCNGLRNGWVDKYENKGKRSGAFSSGSYTGYPYILMNYKDSVFRDVFTLAHEGGHSMHSWYSAKSNPIMQYDYTIFEAEVASTFNEELLFRHLLQHTEDQKLKTYLLCMRAADIVATLYRQTMFAEFERNMHLSVETGTPITLEVLRREYRRLLESYFGSEMILEDLSDLECLRIPHFYTPFYVYKYATGISAAMALAEKVVSGGDKERSNYFSFLKSGGSRYPIETLQLAGIDMNQSAPIQAAIDQFSSLLSEMEACLA